MKRTALVQHLRRHGCYRDREGGRHSIYRNPANGQCAAVPRHKEIKDTVARAIARQLDIPKP